MFPSILAMHSFFTLGFHQQREKKVAEFSQRFFDLKKKKSIVLQTDCLWRIELKVPFLQLCISSPAALAFLCKGTQLCFQGSPESATHTICGKPQLWRLSTLLNKVSSRPRKRCHIYTVTAYPVLCMKTILKLTFPYHSILDLRIYWLQMNAK